jgi:hypothetical protein
LRNKKTVADQIQKCSQTTYNRQGSAGPHTREAVKALIVANHYLETDLEKLKAAVSMGYARGRLFERVPRDRKDWYD